jgi:hypothetical protein
MAEFLPRSRNWNGRSVDHFREERLVRMRAGRRVNGEIDTDKQKLDERLVLVPG